MSPAFSPMGALHRYRARGPGSDGRDEKQCCLAALTFGDQQCRSAASDVSADFGGKNRRETRKETTPCLARYRLPSRAMRSSHAWALASRPPCFSLSQRCHSRHWGCTRRQSAVVIHADRSARLAPQPCKRRSCPGLVRSHWEDSTPQQPQELRAVAATSDEQPWPL